MRSESLELVEDIGQGGRLLAPGAGSAGAQRPYEGGEKRGRECWLEASAGASMVSELAGQGRLLARSSLRPPR